MLARALARPSNLLVLDEPTNDLDLETLDLLQELLADYPGTVLLVSHDRDFLDRTVTSIVASEGDGRWIEYAGGYSDMLAQRGAASASARRPRRSRRRTAGKAAGEAAPQSRRKLSFADQHALKTLPARIDALHAEIGRLEGMLPMPISIGAIRTPSPTASAALEKALPDAAEAEEAWLGAELRREEIEGG